jgi:hypothetical protein
VPDRVTELNRTGAWPFVCHLIGTGYLRLDLDLVGAKHLTGLARALDQPLPRALPPDVDATLMNAVAGLDDPFARVGLSVLRGAGLRVGELLDLELGSIIDYGPTGAWLRTPARQTRHRAHGSPRRSDPRSPR